MRELLGFVDLFSVVVDKIVWIVEEMVGEVMGWGNVVVEIVFLIFFVLFWLVLIGGVNKLFMEVIGDKGCGLLLFIFDKGVIVLLKIVLGRWVEIFFVELIRIDVKEEFIFVVCGKDE